MTISRHRGRAMTIRDCEGLIFDLDGTLIDSAPDIAAGVNDYFAEQGWPHLEVAFVERFIGNGPRRLLLDMMLELGLPSDDDSVSWYRSSGDRVGTRKPPSGRSPESYKSQFRRAGISAILRSTAHAITRKAELKENRHAAASRSRRRRHVRTRTALGRLPHVPVSRRRNAPDRRQMPRDVGASIVLPGLLRHAPSCFFRAISRHRRRAVSVVVRYRVRPEARVRTAPRPPRPWESPARWRQDQPRRA